MMKQTGLYECLASYRASEVYPWHMPGHKRRLVEFADPFSMDITEIEGFDDLHHPEGILRDAMEEAAGFYGTKKTYFLVNGSSCGILAAISAAVKPGEKLLMARNCHKSAYHGALLCQAQVRYLYPCLETEGFYGAVDPETVEKALEEDDEIRAVMLVSPTYEGIVSDIRRIAEIVHRHGGILLVDEAHGAHFPYGKGLDFPESAISQGADVVIQSLHKTLPSLTQTALLHVGRQSEADVSRLEFYLRVYQSSSPSYILMASIDHCIRLMAGQEGRLLMEQYRDRLNRYRTRLQKHLRYLKLYEPGQRQAGENPAAGRESIPFYDSSKLVVLAPEDRDGSWLSDRLRRDWKLEPEMTADRYVILMTSPADTEEGFTRLYDALTEMDKLPAAWIKNQKTDIYVDNCSNHGEITDSSGERNFRPEQELPDRAPETVMDAVEAMGAVCSQILLEEAEGQVCHDYIYIYPPGIPLVVPGERIEHKHIRLIRQWMEHGLEVHGVENSRIGCVCTGTFAISKKM